MIHTTLVLEAEAWACTGGQNYSVNCSSFFEQNDWNCFSSFGCLIWELTFLVDLKEQFLRIGPYFYDTTLTLEAEAGLYRGAQTTA